MRFDSFSIFLIVLIVFVIVVLLTNWYTNYIPKQKEPFVSFHMNQNVGSVVYIPQYSTKNTNTVVSLYDSLYFDYRNGTLIEVLSPESTSGTNDLTGASITGIFVAPRDGQSKSIYDSQRINSDSSVPGYATPQSLVTSTSELYNHFPYNTNGASKYQAFYFSWNKNTFIHLVNLNIDEDGDIGSNGCGSNLKTFTLTPNGLMNSVSITNNLPDYTNNAVMVNAATDILHRNTSYLTGANLYKIATSPPPSNTINKDNSAPASTSRPDNLATVSYDITNGNIVIDWPNMLKIYNRGGDGTVLYNTAYSVPFTTLSATNVFIITDLYPYAAVLVIAYQNNTIVSVITPSTDRYTLLNTVRFNKTQAVINRSTDSEYTTQSGNVSPNDGNRDSYGTTDPRNEIPNGISNVCHDDVSCKWYWFFNSIGKNSGYPEHDDIMSDDYRKTSNVLSDDYFLKTEVVPPVCPQCPMCPNNGVCSNCGGTGGSGTCNLNTTLTPSPKIPGTFTDSSGTVFVMQTDANGNKIYVPLSSIINTNTYGAGSKSTASNAANITGVDANGQFITTADPNTIGGGLAISTMSLDQLGTSAFNNTGSLANNIVTTSGDVVKGVVDTAGNLVGGTIGTAADLAKGAGSGLMQLGNRQGGSASSLDGSGSTVSGSGPVAGGALSPTSDKTFGTIPGKTPVDNYSYYGALQSKGSTYMPVTADFSSFRK